MVLDAEDRASFALSLPLRSGPVQSGRPGGTEGGEGGKPVVGLVIWDLSPTAN